MSRLQSKPQDPAQHARVIESLSAELHVPRGKVELAYGIALRRLENEAAVTDFLTVFARRGARDCLLCVQRRSQCRSRDDCLLVLAADGKLDAREEAA